MQLADFAQTHLPALERDEVRHNLIVAIIAGAAAAASSSLRFWTLGAPGECAVQSPARPIVLGAPNRAQCAALAEATRALDNAGVVGPDQAANWFADRAAALGVRFADPIPQRIHMLDCQPVFPGAPGAARTVGSEDLALFSAWLRAFVHEAVPHDPVPTEAQLAAMAASGRHVFWTVDGEPVAMAAIQRRTRNTVAISAVYTPPALRGRGYAGSVTAAVVERIFAEGKPIACLYTDLRNPFSNRCYAKIGFRPVCDAWHYPRAAAV